MKPAGPHARSRELTQLSARLKVREKQVQCAVRALKALLAFESAPKSVFTSEVEVLKARAFGALAAMEELQSGARFKGQIIFDPDTRRRAIRFVKLRLNTLYGPFLPQKTEGVADE